VSLVSITVTRMEWYSYVWRVAAAAGDKTGKDIAVAVGVDQSTVSRWQTRDPAPRDVLKFAQHYKVPIAEALVNAYDIAPADLGQRDPSPAGLSNAALVAELMRRLGLRADELYAALDTRDAVLTSDRLTRRQRPQP
jgi:hypothetical protein